MPPNTATSIDTWAQTQSLQLFHELIDESNRKQTPTEYPAILQMLS